MNSKAVLIFTVLGLASLVDCRAAGTLRLEQSSAEGKSHVEHVSAKLENLAEEKEFIMNIMDGHRSESLASNTGDGETENCTSGNQGENQQHHIQKRSNDLEKSTASTHPPGVSTATSEQTELSPGKWERSVNKFLGFAGTVKRLGIKYSILVFRFLHQHIRRMLSPLPSLIYNNPTVRSAAASFTWSWIGDKLFTFLTRLQNIPHYKHANEP